MNKPKSDIPDYLHSDLLQKGVNDIVFQKTYETIDKLTQQITISEMRQVGLCPKKDFKLKIDLEKHNANILASPIIDIVNLAIHQFEK